MGLFVQVTVTVPSLLTVPAMFDGASGGSCPPVNRSLLGDRSPMSSRMPEVADAVSRLEICAGVAVGVASSSRAAAPATWGAAIEVPESVAVPPVGESDTIETPGANRSTQDP